MNRRWHLEIMVLFYTPGINSAFIIYHLHKFNMSAKYQYLDISLLSCYTTHDYSSNVNVCNQVQYFAIQFVPNDTIMRHVDPNYDTQLLWLKHIHVQCILQAAYENVGCVCLCVCACIWHPITFIHITFLS